MDENLIVTTVTDCLWDEKIFVSLQAETTKSVRQNNDAIAYVYK